MLSVDKINLYYDHIHALIDVSLNLKEGEIISLIGANGAGKSSVLRAITGLNKVKNGTITYQGKQINNMNADAIVKAGIAMVPEGRRAFPYMNVQDNLLMGAFFRSDKVEIAHDLEKILVKFPRLKERFKQQASTMSGGEQQMLVIGRALMARPKLLLMDEPSLGIAPKIVQDIARSIVDINKEEKVSIILVEQNSKMALNISHRAYVMGTGKVVISGYSKDLLDDDRIRKLYLSGET